MIEMNNNINNMIIIIIAEKMKLPWESDSIDFEAFRSSELREAFLFVKSIIEF